MLEHPQSASHELVKFLQTQGAVTIACHDTWQRLRKIGASTSEMLAKETAALQA